MVNLGFQELLLMLLSVMMVAVIVVIMVIFITKRLTKRNTTDRKLNLLEKRIGELEKR
ncbi:MAG: hypothetical protein H7101_08685 [Deinococcales bacterium]|nr:hypothetical protein [Chitinophagaceae bacterium]